MLLFAEENALVECLLFTMRSQSYDNAAAKGELELVKWLHENKTEGCIVKTMNMAAVNGHLDVLRFLNEHRHDGCRTKACDGASGLGKLNILKWLCANMPHKCTASTLINAALSREEKPGLTRSMYVFDVSLRTVRCSSEKRLSVLCAVSCDGIIVIHNFNCVNSKSNKLLFFGS